MIAIIPIFFEDDQQLWHTQEGRELMLKSFRSAVNAEAIEKTFVFTNDGSILNLSRSLGIDSYVIDIDVKEQKSELLPPGAYSSAKHLQESIKADFDDIMILSFRNPLVTSDAIDKGVAKFRRSRSNALMSVKRSSDHPCQLNAYYRIVDIGFIHIFDDNEAVAPYLQSLNDHLSVNEASNLRNLCNRSKQRLNNQCYPNLCNPRNPGNQRSNLRLTKPFYFDWQSRGVQEKSDLGIYVRVCDDLNMQYMPVDQVPEDTSTEASRLLWIFENHNSARILFQFNGHDKFLGEAKGFDINLQLAGVAFSDGAFRSLVFEDEQGRRYLLVQNSEDSKYQSCSLRALPVGLSGPLEDRTIEIEMDDVYEPIPVEDKDIVGIIYCNLRVAEDDTYDLCEPFPPDEKLWTGSVQQINVKTGKEIMGRQDFPDVFE
ncbi:MAG: hypothetical protein ACYS80_13735, partial [Planctomycetota bacterium]